MNEDEAIQTLRNHVCWVKSKNVKQAIETILDLYKQKKEKIEAMNKGIDELVREKQDLKTELYMNSVSKDKIREVFNNKIMEEKQNVINLHLLKKEDDFNNSFTINAVESKINELIILEKELLLEDN